MVFYQVFHSHDEEPPHQVSALLTSTSTVFTSGQKHLLQLMSSQKHQRALSTLVQLVLNVVVMLRILLDIHPGVQLYTKC